LLLRRVVLAVVDSGEGGEWADVRHLVVTVSLWYSV